MKRPMRKLSALFLAGLLGTGVLPSRAEAPPKAIYLEDFEKIGDGDVPGEMLILSGSFTVKKIDGNSVMELPGDPLEGFGVIYGPGEAMAASARIFGTASGKRSPEFGIGLGDSGGYRLWIMPAVGQVQLVKGEEVVAHAPYAWKSGAWTKLKMQARKLPDGAMQIEGKAWADGENEPKEWAVSTKAAEAISGRASVWGSPYAGTPMRFDDMAVLPAEE